MSLIRSAALGLIASYSTVKAISERSNTEVRAKSKVTGSQVSGSFELVQPTYTSNTLIQGELAGLYSEHTHEVQITEGATDKVYNPFARKDGTPWLSERKVGNIGTFKTDKEGKGHFEISDPYVKLSGPYSVIGKNLSVFENAFNYSTGETKRTKRFVGRGQLLASGQITQ